MESKRVQIMLYFYTRDTSARGACHVSDIVGLNKYKRGKLIKRNTVNMKIFFMIGFGRNGKWSEASS